IFSPKGFSCNLLYFSANALWPSVASIMSSLAAFTLMVLPNIAKPPLNSDQSPLLELATSKYRSLSKTSSNRSASSCEVITGGKPGNILIGNLITSAIFQRFYFLHPAQILLLFLELFPVLLQSLMH